MDLPSRVVEFGRDFFFNFFFFLVAKMTLKTWKSHKTKQTNNTYCRKILGKYSNLYSKTFSWKSKLLAKKQNKKQNKKKKKQVLKKTPKNLGQLVSLNIFCYLIAKLQS